MNDEDKLVRLSCYTPGKEVKNVFIYAVGKDYKRQVEDLKAVCEKHGYTIQGVVAGKGHNYTHMVTMIEDYPTDCILVDNFSVFCGLPIPETLDYFRQVNLKVMIYELELDPTKPDLMFILHTLMAVALEQERMGRRIV